MMGCVVVFKYCYEGSVGVSNEFHNAGSCVVMGVTLP